MIVVNETGSDKSIVLVSLVDRVWIKDKLSYKFLIAECHETQYNGDGYDDVCRGHQPGKTALFHIPASIRRFGTLEGNNKSILRDLSDAFISVLIDPDEINACGLLCEIQVHRSVSFF